MIQSVHVLRFEAIKVLGRGDLGIRVMSQRSLLGALSFACMVVLVGSAGAATIEPGQGDLSVNQGQGFQPINSRVNANVGDSVMVGPGGAATVVYDDGCKVAVQPGAVATIAPLSPCASGSYAQQSDSTSTYVGYAIGAGALAGFGVGVYELTKKSSTPTTPTSSPASP